MRCSISDIPSTFLVCRPALPGPAGGAYSALIDPLAISWGKGGETKKEEQERERKGKRGRRGGKRRNEGREEYLPE